ncbi:MAG: nicotinamide riboside transporter PnuC [Rubrivivax sp.]|nr:nicotinamide riboside transporter PnuC [Rubrivivax sp.]
MLDALIDAASSWLQPQFSLLGSPVTAIELVAVALSLAMVLGNLRVKVWAWPLAILASACYGVLFAASKLYGEAGLQVFFIGVACWGWWQWHRAAAAAQDSHRGVQWMSTRERWRAAALTLAAWPALGLLLQRATDSDVPFADAAPTVASVTGQLLLAAKRVENWLVWLGVNVASVALFAYKGLWLTAVLYGLFAVLSWIGWRAWSRQAAPRD